jgi:hypothetical protein
MIRVAAAWVLCLLGGCAFVYDFGDYKFDGVGDGGVQGPLAVVETSPTGIVLDGRTPVKITFNREVVPDASKVTVFLDGAVAVPGDLSTEDTALVFRPSTPLRQHGTYQVAVSEGIVDLAGAALHEGTSFEFTVPQFGVGDRPSARLDDAGSEPIGCPSIAMDAHGNAMIVFQRGEEIYSTYYRAGEGFLPAEHVATGFFPVLAMSPGGRAALAYSATISDEVRIVARVTSPFGASFGLPEFADDGSLTRVAKAIAPEVCVRGAIEKTIAVNDRGAAVVAWYSGVFQYPSESGVSRNVRGTDGAWSTPQFHSVRPEWSGYHPPSAAIDEDGNAQLLYDVLLGSFEVAYARYRYAAETGVWTASPAVEHGGETTGTQLAVTPAGLFAGAYAGQDIGLVATLQTPNGSSAGSPLEVAAADVSDLHLSVLGGTWVAWLTEGSIGAARRLGASWNSPSTSLIAGNFEENASGPRAAGRGETGDAVLVWQRGSTARWAHVTPVGDGFLYVDARHHAPTDERASRELSVVYDVPGGYGILLWVDAHDATEELRAHVFHNLPGDP